METILAILGLLEAVFTMLGALFDMLTSRSEHMLSASRGTPRHLNKTHRDKLSRRTTRFGAAHSLLGRHLSL